MRQHCAPNGSEDAVTLLFENISPGGRVFNLCGALVMGFCFKHGLFAAEGASTAELSAAERARAADALALADVLPNVDAPARRLGQRNSANGEHGS